jgi:hypothetical protein
MATVLRRRCRPGEVKHISAYGRLRATRQGTTIGWLLALRKEGRFRMKVAGVFGPLKWVTAFTAIY